MTLAAEKLFYGISGALLLLAVFVLQKSPHAEVAALQNQMISQFAVAWQEVIGDQPYFDDVAIIFNSVSEFYVQGADATVALFEHGAADRELGYIATGVYDNIVNSLARIANQPEKPATMAIADEAFMSEPSLLNIVPTISEGFVAGEMVIPVNAETPWVTIQDNFTGQIYCLAIYNNEVNKYLGPCKYDYH